MTDLNADAIHEIRCLIRYLTKEISKTFLDFRVMIIKYGIKIVNSPRAPITPIAELVHNGNSAVKFESYFDQGYLFRSSGELYLPCRHEG